MPVNICRLSLLKSTLVLEMRRQSECGRNEKMQNLIKHVNMHDYIQVKQFQ